MQINFSFLSLKSDNLMADDEVVCKYLNVFFHFKESLICKYVVVVLIACLDLLRISC